MKLVACHFAGSKNIGDAVCCPADYFDFGAPVKVMRPNASIPPCDAVIFGGGAIGNKIGQRAAAAPTRIRIGWGLGETRHGRMAAEHAPDGFDLYGSRDYGQAGAEWVPCVSCMSPLFDELHWPEHDAVLYVNRGRPRPAIEGIPTLCNDVGFAEAVGFLASGVVVVTNSYHGAYWATLLGRGAVVVDAYSSKFHQFRHSPAHAAAAAWKSAAGNAQQYPDALSEAREANRDFFGRVMDLLAA